MQLNTYATLNAFRQRQALAASDTGDDDRMLAKLRSATAQIDRFTGRSFMPTVASRRFNWHNAQTLLFRGYDVLELTGITNGDATTIDPTAIITLGGVNGPIVGVELDMTRAFFVYLTTRTRALTVTGVWGWHDDYANAWKPSTDTIPGGGITSSATTFTITSVSGVDGWNLSPRFTPGQLIKVDAEYMHIVAANSSTNTLTVVRAANGSTAATHSAGSAISIYVPPTDIGEITLRWAGWLYKTEDAGDYSGSVAVPGEDNFLYPTNVPSAIPADLLAALVNLRRVVGAL